MKPVLFILSLVPLLHAVMAMPFKRTFTQSDGSTFKGHAKGDEYLHFIQNEEGDILIYNSKTKNYDYATIKNDRLVPSGIPYKKVTKRAPALHRKRPKAISMKGLQILYQNSIKRHRANRLRSYGN